MHPVIHSFARGGVTYFIARPTVKIRPTERLRTYQELAQCISIGVPTAFVHGSKFKILRGSTVRMLDIDSVGAVVGSWVDFKVDKQVKHRDGSVTFEERSTLPPRDFWVGFLACIDMLPLPKLRGVTTAPYFHAGEVRCWSGYHQDTRMILTRDFQLRTSGTARDAVDRLLKRLETFPFESHAHRVGFIAYCLTAIQRPVLKLVPGGAINAPMAGSGKSMLAQAIGVILLGRKPSNSTPSTDPQELQKHLFGVLEDMHPLHIYDNQPLGYTFKSAEICSMLTSEVYVPRTLGKNKNPVFDDIVLFLILTGNNLKLGTDELRRFLMINIDARVSDPSKREFGRDFLDDCLTDRCCILGDLLTILVDYHRNGRPAVSGTPLGSFSEWCRVIRDPLLWCTGVDVANLRGEVEESSDMQTLAEFVYLWLQQFGETRRTLAEAAKHEELQGGRAVLGAVGEWFHAEFLDHGKFNPKRAGKWLSRYEKRVVDGYRFIRDGEKKRAICWRLQKALPNSPFEAPNSPPAVSQE